MYYIYKFLDKKTNVLYVGRTKCMLTRMQQHFLSREVEIWKEKVITIYYTEFKYYGDSVVYETYFIHKYKSLYNIFGTEEGIGTTLDLPEDLEWKEYLKPEKLKNKIKNGRGFDRIQRKFRMATFEEYQTKIEDVRNKISLKDKWLPTKIAKHIDITPKVIRNYFKRLGYKDKQSLNEACILEAIDFLKKHSIIITRYKLVETTGLSYPTIRRYNYLIKDFLKKV